MKPSQAAVNVATGVPPVRVSFGGLEGANAAPEPKVSFADGAKAAPEPKEQALENSESPSSDNAGYEEFLAVMDDVEGGGVRQRRHSQMSKASLQCDVGGKGFLTKSERVVRKYDVNNDGKFDMNEIKAIVHDLQDSNREKRIFKKVAIGATGCLAVSAAANFGLTWTSLVLTRQLESQNGSLVDASTGNTLSTKARGDYLVLSLNEDRADRVRELLESDEMRRLLSEGRDISQLEEVRKLQEEAAATLEGDLTWAEGLYKGYKEAGTLSYSFTRGGTEYTGHVDTGITRTANSDGCVEFGNIHEVGDPDELFKVLCCESDLCTLHAMSENGGLNDCFSPMSTVIEKNKGKMLLKDLQAGDLVLAKNGVYRPFMYQAHSSATKTTAFLQLHTDSKVDAPLELTPKHLVFLDKKPLPVPAEEVKVGDKLVGVNGPRVVTKIGSVSRDGLYDPLTTDATLVVDGILASALSLSEDHSTMLGPIHSQHLVGSFLAPLIHDMCSKINSYLCITKVDDVDGTQWNAGAMVFARVTAMSPASQAIIFPLLIGMIVASVTGYYLTMILVPCALVLGCVAQFGKKKKVVKVA